MLTYFDCVENLIVSSFGGPQDAEQRDIRTAVHRAYAELTTIRDWAWYHVHGRIITEEPYGTGTVTSSGTSVTLTGGTWPAWAARGAYLKVGEKIARVATRVSDTALTLDSVLSLKDNVTDAPYQLYRTVYPLPSDFRNMDEPSDEYNWWSGLYITPDQAMKLERVSNTSGTPLHWTVIKDPDANGWAIKLMGYPTERETIDFTYRRSARPLRYSGHEANVRQGTIQQGHLGEPNAVEGSGTAFDASMHGSILRVGTPTYSPGSIESLTPWLYEATILGHSANDFLFVDRNLNFPALTKYLITDPIDVAPHMEQAMDSACEYWLARIRGVKPDDAFAMYQRDLRLAMEQDQLAPISGRSRNVWHDGGWRSPLRADVGT
jgi:hypothetical protein